MVLLPLGAWADETLISYTFTAEDASSYASGASLEEGWKNSMGTATGVPEGWGKGRSVIAECDELAKTMTLEKDHKLVENIVIKT